MTENQIVKLTAAINNSFHMPDNFVELLNTYQLRRWSKSYLLDLIIWRQDGTGVIPFGDTTCFTAKVLKPNGNIEILEQFSKLHDYLNESESPQFFVSFRSYGPIRVALIKPAKS